MTMARLLLLSVLLAAAALLHPGEVTPAIDWDALADETDVGISRLPDAATRSRDLPRLMTQVADPTVAISSEVLRELALAMAQEGDRPVGGFVSYGSTMTWTVVDAVSAAGQSRLQQATAVAVQALSGKTGDAWLTTWRTLRGRRVLQPSPGTVAALPIALARAGLDSRRQLLWDGDDWTGWGSPALTALLQGWVEAPLTEYTDRFPRANQVRKLYETDPVAGRAWILRAIREGDEKIDDSALLLLPDEYLPELDEVFRQAVRGEIKWNAIVCASRYGTAAISGDIRALYQSRAGTWACALANAMLRHLVKHDRAGGLQLVREAMTLRGQTGCYKNLLEEVLRPFPGEDCDSLLEGYLQDPSEEVACSAINAIVGHPGAAPRLRAVLDLQGAAMTEMARKYAEARLDQLQRPPGK